MVKWKKGRKKRKLYYILISPWYDHFEGKFTFSLPGEFHGFSRILHDSLKTRGKWRISISNWKLCIKSEKGPIFGQFLFKNEGFLVHFLENPNGNHDFYKLFSFVRPCRRPLSSGIRQTKPKISQKSAKPVRNPKNH